MSTGRALIAEIDAYEPVQGLGALWWLGQQGYCLKLPGTDGPVTVYADAYLSDAESRTVPPVISPAEVTNAGLVLGSHDHGDHVDRGAWPAIAAASPGAAFVVPEARREAIIEATGIAPERVFGLDDGRSVELAGVSVHAVAAAHERLSPDPETGMHPFLGYVIDADELTVYHAGDTCRYEGLWARLARWHFDAALLPINGRDARRLRANCIGNMTYQEAADLAGELEPGLTIPGHYEMFEMNSEDVSLFTDYMAVKYPDLAVIAPRHGEKVEIPAHG